MENPFPSTSGENPFAFRDQVFLVETVAQHVRRMSRIGYIHADAISSIGSDTTQRGVTVVEFIATSFKSAGNEAVNRRRAAIDVIDSSSWIHIATSDQRAEMVVKLCVVSCDSHHCIFVDVAWHDGMCHVFALCVCQPLTSICQCLRAYSVQCPHLET